MALTFETKEQLKEADTDYLKRRGVKRVGTREVFEAWEKARGIEVCGKAATRYYFDDKEPEELPSTRTCVDIPKPFFSRLKTTFDPPGEGGNPMTKEEIQEIATRTADEVIERIQGVPELGLHIAEHEAVGSARVIDTAKAQNPDIPCKCFAFEEGQYCWKPGYLGLISSKKNPEQMATCVVTVPASPGAQKRFAELKGAMSEAHQEYEKEGGGLPGWWEKTGQKLAEKGIAL